MAAPAGSIFFIGCRQCASVRYRNVDPDGKMRTPDAACPACGANDWRMFDLGSIAWAKRPRDND